MGSQHQLTLFRYTCTFLLDYIGLPLSLSTSFANCILSRCFCTAVGSLEDRYPSFKQGYIHFDLSATIMRYLCVCVSDLQAFCYRKVKTFNVCNDLSACYAHECEESTYDFTQILTGKNFNSLTQPRAGMEPCPLDVLSSALASRSHIHTHTHKASQPARYHTHTH